MDDATRTGTTMGTPAYMAPEQARGSRGVDARADVFSLGCVLFECIAGHPPFVGESPIAVLAKILLEDAPRLATRRDDISGPLDDLVARMLAKQPGARPLDGARVAAELDALDVGDAPAQVRSREAVVTAGEQRLVCVVLARGALGMLTGADSSDDEDSDSTSPMTAKLPSWRTGLSALSAAVSLHGGLVNVLADGSIAIAVYGQGAATDQVARAARSAIEVRALAPDAPMALAIGRCVVTDRVPLGELIDRAAALLRVVAEESASSRIKPIRVDEMSAGLLDVRFVIDGDANGLFLVGERDVTDSSRTLLGKPSPCVGRDRELAALTAIFDECVGEPMAHLVLVTAPAGVGKSRLRHEFVQRLGEAAEIWVGRGDPMSAGAPFAMLAQALRRTAGIEPGDPIAVRHMKLKARVLRDVAPAEAPFVTDFLAELVGAALPDEHDVQLRAARQDPRLMGDQIRRACEAFVTATCAVRPLVLVLEDLHWGDLPTVRFVDTIVRELQGRPLMVLAFARPEIETVFPRLWSERSVERIHLAELTRRAAEKLVREALVGIDPATVARLVDRAAGNAFCLEELVRSVAEGKGDKLPETVIAMAQARIDGLEVEARHLLRAASVFGQTFWRGGVVALLEGATTQVDDWLDQLVGRELVTARRESRFAGDPEYAFRHSLVREAAYAMLTERDRTRGHRRAGEWLEQRVRSEQPGERAGEADVVVLADHFERGAEPQRAVTWYRRAAEQALEGDDLVTALDRAQRAIDCLHTAGGTIDGDVIGGLRQLQADAHVWRGEYSLAIERGDEALAVLRVPSPQWLAAVAAVVESRGRRLEHEHVLALAEQLADLTPPAATHRAYVQAVAMTIPTILYQPSGDLIERLFAILDRIEREIGTGDPATLAWICHAHSWRAMRDGDLGGCLERNWRTIECFVAVGDLRHACQQRGNIGYDEFQLGAFARAEASLRETIVAATRIGLHQVTTQAQHNLGLVLARLGQIEEARAIELVALDAFTAQDNRRLRAAALDYLGVIEHLAGNHDAAIRYGLEAIEGGTIPLTCVYHANLAIAYLAAGNATSALAFATTANDIMAEHGRPEEGEHDVRLAYAEALHATGDHERARRVIREAKAAVLEAAEKIHDLEWRRSYLEAIPQNARILVLAQRWA